MPKIYKQTKYNSLLFGRSKEIKKNGLSMVEFSSIQKSKFKINQVYAENSELIDTYLLFFVGIFITVMLFILIAPSNLSNQVFSSEGWDSSLVPSKSFGFENVDKFVVFKDIIVNNLSVLFVCFLFALIFPTAGILIVVWNAVVWGLFLHSTLLLIVQYIR